VRREILRGRGVRIRLALLGVARLRFLVRFCGLRAMNLAVCGVVFHDAGLLAVRQRIVVRGLLMRGLVVKCFGFFAVSLVLVIFFLLMRGSGVR
jgi:hypothetical protein